MSLDSLWLQKAEIPSRPRVNSFAYDLSAFLADNLTPPKDDEIQGNENITSFEVESLFTNVLIDSNTWTNCHPCKFLSKIHIFQMQRINLRAPGWNSHQKPRLRGYTELTFTWKTLGNER